MDLRSPPLPLLPESLDNLGHLLPRMTSINPLSTKTHANLLMRTGAEKALFEELAHIHADEDAAVAAAVLLGGVIQWHEADLHVEEVSEFLCYCVRLPDVTLVEGVVVEGDAVDDRY